MGAAWVVATRDVLPVNRAHALLARPRGRRGDRPLHARLGAGGGLDVVDPDAGPLRRGLRLFATPTLTPEAAQGRDRGGARPRDRAAQRHPHRRRPPARRLDRQRAWPLGLASSFLEPLEATSIHGTIVPADAARRVARRSPAGRDRYNAAVARQVDDFRDFIRLHYVSERRDTPFWRDVAASHPRRGHRPPRALARQDCPTRDDFAPFPGSASPTCRSSSTSPSSTGSASSSREARPGRDGPRPRPAPPARRRPTPASSRNTPPPRAQCLPHRAWLQSLDRPA